MQQIEFRVLGPLEVWAEGRALQLRRPKQRALLAVLLLRAGEVVSTDRLIEELWAGKPPRAAVGSIQNLISDLRKALGRDLVRTRQPGYVLDIEPEQVDLHRFERLVAQASEGGDAERRSELLRAALSLWRGPPLADLELEPFARVEVARLEELHTTAREALIDAELELGRHAQLIGELETLVTENPLRERLRGQLMLALYRSGRQAEALEAYRRARETLVDELGIDPSPELQQLEQSVLRHDAELDLPAAPISTEEPTGERRRRPPSCSPTSWTRRAWRRPSIRRFCERSYDGTSTRSGRSSNATAARSRSSWATPRWPSSECRRRTRRTRFVRCARRTTCAKR